MIKYVRLTTNYKFCITKEVSFINSKKFKIKNRKEQMHSQFIKFFTLLAYNLLKMKLKIDKNSSS